MTKKQSINMLKEIKRVATEASLTGALRGGVKMYVNTYNSIRQKAIEKKWIDDDGIIPVLDTNAGENMDSVGCVSALLIGLLRDEDE